MCGINGIISIQIHSQLRKEKIERMNLLLAHRGPDNQGYFEGEGFSFGHRRLSIIDLSEDANQPMISYCGRYSIVYNGEIYNYKSLRKELDYPFSTQSDSEVILASFIKWGTQCLQYFDGMFSFVIADIKENRFFFSRDRMGIKPLYYALNDDMLVFSSEVKAILDTDLFTRTLAKNEISTFFNYKTVHSPNSIWEHIKVLEPAHYMIWELKDKKVNRVEHSQYWEMQSDSSISNSESLVDIQNNIKEYFFDAVNKRLVSDVPVSTFLSGGIDSASIAAVMRELSDDEIHSFHINFLEKDYSEAKYAQIVAKEYNLDHHEIQLKPSYFLENFEEGLAAMDHPSEDGLNVFMVSKAVKDYGFKVVLSGLGGDELFGGYYTFDVANKIINNQWLYKIPVALRKKIFALRKIYNPGMVSDILDVAFSSKDFNLGYMHSSFRRNFTDKELNLILKNRGAIDHSFTSNKSTNLYSSFSILEIQNYTQSILLRDTDQMSMRNSLEVRVPFLDYKFVEYVLSIPNSIKIECKSKALFTNSLRDLLPKDIVSRKKMGFNLPIENWLKNDLKSWSNRKIEALSERDFINTDQLISIYRRFENGDKSIPYYKIWPLLIFEHYLESNKAEY